MSNGNRKLLNDPVYGFVTYPYDILYQLLDHPYVQRLRRIKQLGMTHYVYPGAVHTRLHHAMGALHLMDSAILVLRSKGIEISDEEAKAVMICILLHDIGHGPCSHALEGRIISVSHEFISLQYMIQLNEEFDGQLDLAIEIYKNEYSKKFLSQLVASQLDMDRLDYLNRDSYYSGVAEGVIGFDRIIKMLNVAENQIVVEEKGIYSIEKFLMARRIMYWQVYLHKTALATEQMLIRLFEEAKSDPFVLDKLSCTNHPLLYFLKAKIEEVDFRQRRSEILSLYSKLDDHDIFHILKIAENSDNPVTNYYGRCLLNRDLMKIILKDSPFEQTEIDRVKKEIQKNPKFDGMDVTKLLIAGKESNVSYNTQKEEIKIVTKEGEIQSINDFGNNMIDTSVNVKYFLCFPKINL